MLVNVTLFPQKNGTQKVKIDYGATGMDLLEILDLAIDAYILTRDNEPISIDEELKDNDELGIIRVVSGG